jgi:hypothetical protein
MTTLVLRTLSNTGDTTKGSPLTNAEIDNNFIALKLALTSSTNITGGTINGTSIGGTTRSSGAFTTLTANGATTLTASTASTSTSTGALVVTGGLGVGGAVFATSFSGNGAALTNLNANNIASGTLAVTRGGTGVATLEAGTYLKGNGTSAISTQTGVPVADITGILDITKGGTGASSFTAGTYLKGNGSSSFTTQSGVPVADITGTLGVSKGGTGQTSFTNGQLLIGNTTGNTLVKATLTAGAGISITNGPGTITIAAQDTSIGVSNDTATDATRFILFGASTSGTVSSVNVSDTKLTFNPSTGTLSATNLNSLSDRNLKTEIKSIEKATEVVNMLDGVSFTWKDNGLKSFGVIAQELETVLPELVEGKEVKTVNYSGIIAFLINAVNELDARVKELEKHK